MAAFERALHFKSLHWAGFLEFALKMIAHLV